MATGTKFPPYFDLTGAEPAGFDVEFARLLARRLGKSSVRFDPGKGARTRVDARDADLAIAAISVTDARARETLFSRPYLRSRFVVARRASVQARGFSLAQARCSVHSGHALYRGMLKSTGCQLVLASSHADALQKLLNGQADATVVDEGQLDDLPAGIEPAAIVLGEDAIAVGLKLGNEALKARVDQAIEAMIVDGSVDALARRHGLRAAGQETR